ncbi:MULTISPECIES: hypothetical protein [unclassified Sphingomonas]|jgi:uncharacterized membrane protein|uniref:hypothetical protein n=1 Tax=unclassified Sphingomonas TaxID=196159 RepID=UPI0008372B4C|nr:MULTISPECIES: hypothetical protein [unclassified Sphingomonas]MCH4892960.1 hypothetical protein [Sphingomonas sp. SFZ2018-12]
MPFREKIAWITLGAVLLLATIYFGGLIGSHAGPAVLRIHSIVLLIGAVIIATLYSIIATTIVALRGRDEATAPADERDRMISTRAASIAYPVLILAMLAAGISAHLGNSLIGVLNALLGALVVAELVRCAAEIIGYRRS